MHNEEKDRLVWNLSKGGCFSIKSLYDALEGMGVGFFQRKMIWNPCVPNFLQKLAFLFGKFGGDAC